MNNPEIIETRRGRDVKDADTVSVVSMSKHKTRLKIKDKMKKIQTELLGKKKKTSSVACQWEEPVDNSQLPNTTQLADNCDTNNQNTAHEQACVNIDGDQVNTDTELLLVRKNETTEETPL